MLRDPRVMQAGLITSRGGPARSCGHEERPPIGRRCRLENPPKVFAQRRGRLQPDRLRDPLDRPIALLEQLLSAQNPLVRQPAMRSGSGLLLESTSERSRRHVRVIREIVDRQHSIEMRVGPREDARESPRFFGQNGPDRELCLPSFTKGWDDEPACHLVGDLRSKVAADDMQAQIDPRGTAGVQARLSWRPSGTR